MDASPPSPPGPVTIRDVALKAKVSKSTVSLALRGDARIAETTRKHVQQVAEALGYRPDPAVTALLAQVRRRVRHRHGGTLALLENFQVRDEWRRYHSMRAIAEGARARANELGYEFETHWLRDPACPPGRLFRMLHARGVEGLLLMDEPDAQFDALQAFSVVNVRSIESSLPAACVDSARLGQQARDGLARLGYRRIGRIFSHTDAQGAMSLSHWAFRLARAHPQEPEVSILPVLESGPFRFYEDLKKVFWPWFNAFRPDVIVGTEEHIPVWLEEQGLRVPKDLAFAMLDRDPDDPRFAGVHALHRDHGAAAVDLVVGQIHRGEHGPRPNPKRVSLDPHWTDGPSAPGPDAPQ